MAKFNEDKNLLGRVLALGIICAGLFCAARFCGVTCCSLPRADPAKNAAEPSADENLRDAVSEAVKNWKK